MFLGGGCSLARAIDSCRFDEGLLQNATPDSFVTLVPSAALAADVFGFVASSESTSTQFGTIDPASGIFTQIGGTMRLQRGAYAPVFDPDLNAFLVTSEAISSVVVSNLVDKIDPATGAVAPIVVNTATNAPQLVYGLGVATQLAAAPEPSTCAMMFVGFAGIAFA